MNDHSAVARERAISCEVRKTAYRQTKDGVVISFLLHPNDVPDELAVSDLGARYMAALVRIGDDETPIPPQEKEAPTHAEVGPGAEPLAARPRKVSSEKRLAQQAGIACSDPVFQRFLMEQYEIAEQSEEQATEAVRRICGVTSRTEILPGSIAASEWDRLASKFTAWKLT